MRKFQFGEPEDIADAVGRATRKITVNIAAVKPDRLPSDIGGNQGRLSALVSPQVMAFALPLLMIKIRQGIMTKSIIPWHVFQNAVETPDSNSLSRWLERWRFMDGGVVLADGNVPALGMTRTNSNPRHETTVNDDSDAAKEIIHSPQPMLRTNKRFLP